MTNGGKKRRARDMLKDLCARAKQHQWKGDKKIRCEVCNTPKP